MPGNAFKVIERISQQKKRWKVDFPYLIMQILRRAFYMKNHKFWAWAAVICMIMTFYTGYKHK